MFTFLRYCFVSLLLFLLIAAAVCAGGIYYLVVVNPGPEIEESSINDILGRESPVFYRDGQTKVGILFEGIHRQYLTYNELPKMFVKALVAAEDDQFFSHFGIDVPGIARAMIVNIQAGKVVQGGSTITQQTAKNLFKRESRSLRAKVKELLFALRLEHKYSKEKILEFYSNQFFVSGNGHGLGVAARYFFDKAPQDLTLLECAFIAGSVKRPNYYNPFLRKNTDNIEQTRQRVKERTDYVLGKMLKERMIDEAVFKAAKAEEIIFNQGKMTFAQSTIMDLVKEGVQTPVVAEALEENGISNISTSGARVITSLDREMQDKTVQALRRHLSRLDVNLRGYQRSQVQEEYGALDYAGDTDLVPGAFVFGTVGEVSESKEQGPRATVVFPEGQKQGILDDKGLEHLASVLVKFKKGPWAKSGPADRKTLFKELQPGDKVYVSLREIDGDGQLRLDLERYPQVEGGAFVLQEGAIRAMSGGMSNLNYNRATSARRLMGSTFKPFLFAAALQLGWSPVDMISNQRATFTFMNRPYEPQPDHDSPFSSVSLSWAGVTSENVAAVWLLYHLTDHLSTPAIYEMARQLDMAPRVEDGKSEDYARYKARIRDKFGIIVTQEHVEQAALRGAIKTLKPDLVFENLGDEYNQLIRMRSETEILGLRSLLPALLAYREHIQEAVRRFDPDNAFDNPQAVPTTTSGARLVRDTTGRYIFTQRQDLPPNWMEIGPQEIGDHLSSLGPAELESFWQQQVKLDGLVSAQTLRLVEEQLQTERQKFAAKQPYTLDVLSEVREFRIMLGLQYMVRLAKACGIDSRFEPVLSLPLGSNVVTLSEMTRMYETLITGSRNDPGAPRLLAADDGDGRADRDAAAIIERIETPDGRVVYSRQVVKTPVIDGQSSAAVSNILQNVVPYGTGKFAREHVRLHSSDPAREKTLAGMNLPFPLLGKTGTANDYRNTAFIGHVPVLSPQDLSTLTLRGGYTVGVYVGYDDNQSMTRGATRISGSLGALPAWSDIAQGLLDVDRIGDRLDMVDLAFNGLNLQYPEVKQVFVPVDPQRGGAVVRGAALMQQSAAPSGPASLSFGVLAEGGRFEPERLFLPFWQNR